MGTFDFSDPLTAPQLTRTIRRYWWIVVILGVLGWLIGHKVLPDLNTSTAKVTASDPKGLAVGAALQGFPLDITRSSTTDLAGRLTKNAASLAVGDTTVSASPASSTEINVVASGSVASDVDASMQRAIAFFKADRVKEIQARASAATDILNSRKSITRQRLDDLDARIKAATTNADTVALSVERANVRTDVDHLDAALSILDAMKKDDGGITADVVAAVGTSQSSLLDKSAVGYAVLGAMLGALVLVVLAKRRRSFDATAITDDASQ
jgi:uncharacterized membrane protein YeaQ/YmgE (transglycosylase-associated protein family)